MNNFSLEHQEQLQRLQNELDTISRKVSADEPLMKEDIKFISDIGWLSALSVSLVALTSI
jgi:hypothetical protein